MSENYEAFKKKSNHSDGTIKFALCYSYWKFEF